MTYANRVVSALADPTRFSVLEKLRDGPRSVGEIANEMPVSRPAVSQHLKVLKDVGLVGDRSVGTRRIYYIDPKGLGAMRAWLGRCMIFSPHKLHQRRGKIARTALRRFARILSRRRSTACLARPKTSD